MNIKMSREGKRDGPMSKIVDFGQASCKAERMRWVEPERGVYLQPSVVEAKVSYASRWVIDFSAASLATLDLPSRIKFGGHLVI